jgi:hypothetical protein
MSLDKKIQEDLRSEIADLTQEITRLRKALDEAVYDLERIMTADWCAEQMRLGAQSGAYRARKALKEGN